MYPLCAFVLVNHTADFCILATFKTCTDLVLNYPVHTKDLLCALVYNSTNGE